MAPLELDGDTLGEKHKLYNKLLQEGIASNQPVSEISLDDDDVGNLLKIDLASHNRDVDYILNVLKSGDMLCVSKALTRSTWLITDNQYAHIINPEYLQTQLQPLMTIKAFIKLNKHIRLHLKDEGRAEQFYLHEKVLSDAVKWLPLCSESFIEKNIEKHASNLKVRTFKRLCEKSIDLFGVTLKHIPSYNRRQYAEAVTFILNTDVDKYLDVLLKDTDSNMYGIPKFNDKATAILMKKSPKRIIDHFDFFASSIDIPTFCKFLKPNEIKTFLYKQATKQIECYRSYTYNYDLLKHFINRLPKNEQFNFVKKIFIDKDIAEADEENLTETEISGMKKLCHLLKTPTYMWYTFAPFQLAFDEITGLISRDLDNRSKQSMLTVLISCTDPNLDHIQTLLKYYLDKHRNEEYRSILKFVTELLNHTHVCQYDEKTWNLLNELFKILKIYDESNSSSEIDQCVEAILTYNILHDQKIPSVVEKQLKFSIPTLKFRNKLNPEQNEKLFRYYFENQLSTLNEPIKNEEDLDKSIQVLSNILKLLRDWKKQLLDFPVVVDKIRDFVQLKREKSWNVDFSVLFNVNKSWRRSMFEDSVTMNPGEEVCINALKHDPQLLLRHNSEVGTLRTNDAVSLRRLLAKLRVYWRHSLAQQWTDEYFQNLNISNGYKATIRGLCTTLPREPLYQLIEKYKPAQAKIDWNTVDDRILSIQRVLAKTMHIARPQPSPDAVLFYAKGDYLQFALPSLLAIFYNLNITETRKHIPKLLDAPVSVQKHGIRLAFGKLDHEAIKKIFLDCWKSSKNASIRAIIFTFTFKLLCQEKDPAKAVGLWELIELFIDNLSFEEDKTIYNLLADIDNIPLNVRSEYLMKSYKFMKSLIPKVKEAERANYENLSAQLAHHSKYLMEKLPQDFVTSIIQEFINKDFFGSENNFGSVESSYGIIPVISAYLLCAKDENVQIQKYEEIFVPIMTRAFAMWAEKRDGNFIIRSRFRYLLMRLGQDLKEYAVENNMIMPVKMFMNIQNELQKTLSVSENYLMLTKWKLIVAIVKLADKANSDTNEWNILYDEIAPEFATICLHYLKEDVKLHFSCIYKLYCKALKEIIELISPGSTTVIYNSLLSDIEFVQGYLAVLEMTKDSYKYNPTHYDCLWNQIQEHPSVEVKMHYYYLGGERVKCK